MRSNMTIQVLWTFISTLTFAVETLEELLTDVASNVLL